MSQPLVVEGIKESCMERCKMACRENDRLRGSDTWVCLSACMADCFYSGLTSADPCLGQCAARCGALEYLYYGNLTAEKMDCIVKCRATFCNSSSSTQI